MVRVHLGLQIGDRAFAKFDNMTSMHVSRIYRRKYTKERVQKAVDASTSVVQVLHHLGIRYRSGFAWQMIRSYIEEYEIDVSHFKGHAQNKGLRSPWRKTPHQIFRFITGHYRVPRIG